MELPTILFVYLILICVIFAILWRNAFHFWEAFVISIVIGLFFIFVVYPPQELDMEKENISCSALYIFIIVMTFLIILIYAMVAAYSRRISQDKACVVQGKIVN